MGKKSQDKAVKTERNTSATKKRVSLQYSSAYLLRECCSSRSTSASATEKSYKTPLLILRIGQGRKRAYARSLAAHLSAIQQCISVARVLLAKKHKRERNRKDNTPTPADPSDRKAKKARLRALTRGVLLRGVKNPGG